MKMKLSDSILILAERDSASIFDADLTDKIIAFMEPLGGKFRENISEHEWNMLSRTWNFSLFRANDIGINIPAMEIVTVKSRHEIPWRFLIHEFAHLLADRGHPAEANDGDFIAWEKRVAEIIGAPMDVWHSRADILVARYLGRLDYDCIISNDPEMPSTEEINEYYERQLLLAKQRGIINENDRPVAIRLPGTMFKVRPLNLPQ